MSRREKLWLAVLLAAVVVRLLTLAAYPLHDTTEARYAEIARLMVTSGDWVVPQIRAGVPFWGKPPLSMWLTSASFTVFGINEFAARLPVFLLTLASAGLAFAFARSVHGRLTGIAAAAILLTTAQGFVIAGAVMTDAALLACTTLAMLAFWRCAVDGDKRWGYGFFAAVGLGLLAKGPVALIMIGVPVFGWLLLAGGLAAFRRLPWIGGSLLTLLIAAPWYLLAESRSPGFLEYFLIGEHWSRFVDSGWQGDLYGEAHARPRGTIWLFGLLAALPWSIPALSAAVRHRKAIRSATGLQAYLLLWMLTPLLFFTFAGNILPTYVATGLPAFSVLVAAMLARRPTAAPHLGWIVPGAIVCLLPAAAFLSLSGPTQRGIIAWTQAQRPESPLYYYLRKPHSADFYAGGRAQLLSSADEFNAVLDSKGEVFVAMRKRRVPSLPEAVRECLRQGAESPEFVVFEKPASGCPLPE